MIKRSEFEQIKKNPTVLHLGIDTKFFNTEAEAISYKNSLSVLAKMDQWALVLDDVSEEEALLLKAEKEASIEAAKEKSIAEFGKNYLNASTENFLRSLWNHKDIWSVTVVGVQSDGELLEQGAEYGTYDDEINGATAVDKPTVNTAETRIERDGIAITMMVDKQGMPIQDRMMRIQWIDKDGYPQGLSTFPDWPDEQKENLIDIQLDKAISLIKRNIKR